MKKQGFYKEMARHHADNADFLIYCDWMEEKGELPAIQLLRRHIELRQADAADKRWPDVITEQNRLAHDSLWKEIRTEVLPHLWNNHACARLNAPLDDLKAVAGERQTAVYYDGVSGLPTLAMSPLVENSETIRLHWTQLPKTTQYPTMDAAIQKNLMGVVEMRYENGENISGLTRGLTPLHLAVYSGANDVVEWLIAAGVDVNAPSSTRLTPLHMAAQVGNMDAASCLLSNGADPALRNGKGQIARYIACENKNFSLADLIFEFTKKDKTFSSRFRHAHTHFDDEGVAVKSRYSFVGSHHLTGR